MKGRVARLTLDQKLEMNKLSEEGMSKAKTGGKLSCTKQPRYECRGKVFLFSFIFLFFNVYLFFEGDREYEEGRGRERRRHRIQSRLHAQHRAQCGT